MATVVSARSGHGPHRRTDRPCALCLAAAQPFTRRPRDTRFPATVDALGPWIVALAATVGVVLGTDGTLRILVAGVALGLLGGATLAWRLHLADRAIGVAAVARVRAQVTAESEARVNAVIQQFDWAVHDVAALRAKLAAAELELGEHRQHAFTVERDLRRLEGRLRARDRRTAVDLVVRPAVAAEASVPVADEQPPVDLQCELHDAGPLPLLELSAADVDELPARVRVLDRAGSVVAVSDPAVHGATPTGVRTGSLRLPLPGALAGAAMRGVLDDYRFEALVAHRWAPAHLAWRRPITYRDKRGRVYRRAVLSSAS